MTRYFGAFRDDVPSAGDELVGTGLVPICCLSNEPTVLRAAAPFEQPPAAAEPPGIISHVQFAVEFHVPYAFNFELRREGWHIAIKPRTSDPPFGSGRPAPYLNHQRAEQLRN